MKLRNRDNNYQKKSIICHQFLVIVLDIKPNLIQKHSDYHHCFSEIICYLRTIRLSFRSVLTVEPWQSGGSDLSYPVKSGDGECDWVQNTTDRVTLSNETLMEIVRGR